MRDDAPSAIAGEQSLSSAQRAAVLAAIMNENIASVRAALAWFHAAENDHIPLSEQGARLNKAFFKIQGPIAREAIIVLVEGLSAGPWWEHLTGKAPALLTARPVSR